MTTWDFSIDQFQGFPLFIAAFRQYFACQPDDGLEFFIILYMGGRVWWRDGCTENLNGSQFLEL